MCGAGVQLVSGAAFATCEYCGTMILLPTEATPTASVDTSAAQPQPQQLAAKTVFARWRDGNFYPAVLGEVVGDLTRVSYLDGDVGMAAPQDIVELEEGFRTMTFKGNWKNGGIFYKCTILSREPLTVKYTWDGVVEQISLSQLRGKR